MHQCFVGEEGGISKGMGKCSKIAVVFICSSFLQSEFGRHASCLPLKREGRREGRMGRARMTFNNKLNCLCQTSFSMIYFEIHCSCYSLHFPGRYLVLWLRNLLHLVE